MKQRRPAEEVQSKPHQGRPAPTREEPNSVTSHRDPYVGAGADGARRSAQIDREELETLDQDDPRRPAIEASREAWLDQAAVLEEHERPS